MPGHLPSRGGLERADALKSPPGRALCDLGLFVAQRAAVGGDGHIGLADAEADGCAGFVGVDIVGGIALAAPGDGDDSAVPGVVALAGAGHLGFQVALLVLDMGVGLQYHHIAEFHGGIVIAVHGRLAVLAHPVEAAVRVIVHDGLLAVLVEPDGDLAGGVTGGHDLVGEAEAVIHILHGGVVAGLPGGVHEVLAGGHQGVLIALVGPAPAVPVEGTACTGDAVEIVVALLFDQADGLIGAARAGENGTVMLGHPEEVGADGPDGTDDTHIGQIMEDGHEPGDGALGHDLVEDISLADAALGHGLDQIVNHNGVGAAIADRVQRFAGQGIDIHRGGLSGIGGGHGRRGRHSGFGRCGGHGDRGGGCRGFCGLGAAGTQHQADCKDQRERSFHGIPFLSNAAMASFHSITQFSAAEKGIFAQFVKNQGLPQQALAVFDSMDGYSAARTMEK